VAKFETNLRSILAKKQDGIYGSDELMTVNSFKTARSCGNAEEGLGTGLKKKDGLKDRNNPTEKVRVSLSCETTQRFSQPERRWG